MKSFKCFAMLSSVLFTVALHTSVTTAAPTVNAPTVSTLASDGLNTVSFGGYMNGESFQQEGITSYNSWQYAAYWNNANQVVIARRQLPAGSWQNTDYYADMFSDSLNTVLVVQRVAHPKKSI